MDQKNSCDLIIRGVSVIDGTGSDRFLADVGVDGDKITLIGDLSHVVANHDVDGRGKCLAPGFIDVHTHDDIQVIKTPDMMCKTSQGVSTVIVGNCGISASPVTLKSDPPDPMNLLGKRKDFCYPSVAAYAEAVNSAGPSINVAALIGHTSLRNNVMSELKRPATDAEVNKMRDTLANGMAEGAVGLSSGLAYANAKQAPNQEVIALAQVLQDFNGVYTTHLRDEFVGILEAMDEAFELGQTAKVPVVISHFKCAGKANWGRSKVTLQHLKNAAEKQDVCCDAYPYTASSSTLDLEQVTEDFDILITWSSSFPEVAGRMLKDIAHQWNMTLDEAALKIQPAGAVYHNMHEDDVQRILSYSHTMIGSDGLPNDPIPHPRLWGTFPRVLGHYARDLSLFSLEEAVRKMTSLPAKKFHLFKRGQIKVGFFADLVLFDADQVNDIASFSRPKQASSGIEQLWVNGKLSYQYGVRTTSRSGRFLKHNKD